MRNFFSGLFVACALTGFVFVSACSDEDPLVPPAGSSSSGVSVSPSSATGSVSSAVSSSSAAASSASSQAASSGGGTAEETTAEPYDFSGNIASLRAAIDPTGSASSVATFTLGSPVVVTGVVHAVNSAGKFWIQDKDAGIYFYTSAGDLPSVGEKVSMTVTGGCVYNYLVEATSYTGYSVLSSGNAVYRRSGASGSTLPNALQGQAWQAVIVLTASWNHSTTSKVVDSGTGLRARNLTGTTLTAGTYYIRGPLNCSASYNYVDIYPGMAERTGDASSSSAASSSGSASSTSWSASATLGSYDIASRVRIGSFNIEIFGTTKASRPNTMTVLASIATNFSIIAIQEVGSNSDPSDSTCVTVLDAYVARINQLLGGTHYAYVRGHQYAFVYRTAHVSMDGYALYSGTKSFSYPPLAAKFSIPSKSFDFVLLTIHTSPTSATTEISYLPTAMAEVAVTHSDPDVICLGDFNADGTYYSDGGDAQGWLAGFSPASYTTVIPNGTDTTVSTGNTHTYDRIQHSQTAAQDYTGTWGVLKFSQYYDISQCEGPSITGIEDNLSDHYPVWAEFWVNQDTD